MVIKNYGVVYNKTVKTGILNVLSNIISLFKCKKYVRCSGFFKFNNITKYNFFVIFLQFLYS